MTTLLLSAGLRGRRCILTVILIASMLFGPTDLIAQTGCVGPAGETQVAVDLIRDALGTPIVESTDKTRREYAHITSGLRDALGLTVPSDPDDDVRPQIRVIVETDNSGLRSTANFTVESVITDSALRVEIYDVDPGEGSTDEDSGTFKLFGAGGFDAAATLNVHAAAPSRSEVDDNGTTTVTQNFCEPDVNHAAGDANEVYGFFEEVTLGASRDFALLVPHGGLIEEETEAQVAEMAAAFAARNQPFNAWLATAHWDDDVASELFHITSKATDPQTYPGLDALLDAGDFDSVDEIEFQYAASLHGFGSFDRPGLVLGGRAPQEIKCYVARQIQQRLISEAEPAIAYYVYDSDGDSDTALDLPDGDDVRITDQRPDVGLTGRSCDNIVNRFTQDSGCDVGHGGIQIEESAALRDDAALRQLVSEEIANGFIDMILDPNLVDPASTTWCDALETTATAGPGQIGDRVWVDLDNNGVQDPGEAGREGVAVELLETGVVVASTTTSASGQYLFTDLPSATYTVRFTAPSGFTFSPASGGDEATDSDALAGGETGTILIDPGVTRLDVDAGLHPDGTAGQIGDFVWQDDNGDGVQDAGEAGLAGVQVDLTTALGTAVASTTSDTNGAYLFTGLLPGDYVVTFSASDWVATTPSHVGPFPLAADAVDLSRDAGFKASCDEFALVAFGSDWKYPGTSGAWSSTWNQDTFDDSSWTSGAGLLGFSESTTVHTTVPNGSSTVTYYFRHTFDVDDASILTALDLEIERDDAAIVYLNGQEVLRSNLPTGPIDASTRAIDKSWERVSAALDPAALRDGSNLLAVEIHQRFIGDDADFAFDLELRASSCNPCNAVTLDLTPVADTYLRQNEPDKTKGGLNGLWADGGTGEGRSMLIEWDLSSVPAGTTILGAEILLDVVDHTSAFYPLYGLVRDWTESQATWNRAQTGVSWQAAGATGALDRDNSILGVAHVGSLGSYTLSLTAAGRQQVSDWATGTATNHGLIVAAGNHTNGFKVDSREGSDPPLLRLVHTSSCAP